MKKAILFAFAAMISIASFSQKKEKADTAVIHSEFIKLDSTLTIKVADLKAFLKTAIVSQSDEYWFGLFEFIKTVKQDKYNAAQLDQLVSPFANYAQQYIKRKQEEEKNKPKQ